MSLFITLGTITAKFIQKGTVYSVIGNRISFRNCFLCYFGR